MPPRSEIRIDPVTGRRVIVAAHRAERPDDFGAPEPGRPCPFCPGNERETPPEIDAWRPAGSAPDDPSWLLRVVPNRYPALMRGAPRASGAHEVLIETREHDLRFENFSDDVARAYLRFLQRRIAALGAERGIAQVVAFRNCGRGSGASLVHPHTQILALPERTGVVEAELGGACRMCRSLAEELEANARVVEERAGFLAAVPFAARFGGEVRIAKIAHPVPFGALDGAARDELALLLRATLRRVARAFDAPATNVTLDVVTDGAHHWHLDVLPRLAGVGGFELATGQMISSLAPESSAARLRASIV